MPKARRSAAGSKKRPAGVGIDFIKAKAKVGRKLAPADNATDTTVHSKTLTLPSQSVAADRGGAATASSRGLTLGELVGQLSHPASRVRADALAGVAELAREHPGAAARAAGPTLEALADRAGDGDAGVRARLGDALISVLVAVQGGGTKPGGGAPRPSTSSATTPFIPLLLAHARRAMTAVDPGVRRDALALAGDIVETCGGAGGGAGGADDALLAAAAGLLAPGLRSGSLAAGSLAALARTAAGVRRLLVVCARGVEEGGGEAGPPMEEEPPSPQPLFWRRCGWPPAGEGGPGGARGPGAPPPPPPPPRGGLRPAGQPDPALDPLIAGLLRAWEECAPAALALARPATGRGDGGKRQVGGGDGGGARPAKRGKGGGGGGGGVATPAATPASPEAAPTCAADVVACLRLALRRAGGDGGGAAAAATRHATAAAAHSVLARLPAPAPPAGSAAAAHPPTLAALARLNVEGVRLLGDALPVLLAGGGGGGEEEEEAAGAWAAPLLDLAASLLADGRALPPPADAAGGEDGGASVASAPVPPGAAAAALAAVERSLPVLPPHAAAGLLASVGALAARRPAACPDRLAAVRAQTRLLGQRGADGGCTVPDAVAAAWVRPLPRWVWEAAGATPAAAGVGLRALHAAARAARPGTALEAALTDMGDELATLLASAVGAGGGGKQEGGGKAVAPRRILLGPLARLPPSPAATPSAACLAVDLVEYLPSVRTPLMSAAALLALSGGSEESGGKKKAPSPADPALGPRLVASIARRAGADASAVDPIGFGGLLLSLLTGGGAGGGAVGPPGWERHEAATRLGRAALAAAGDPGSATAALEPGLLGAVDGAENASAGAKAALGALATLGAAVAGQRAGGAGPSPGLRAALPHLVASYVTGGCGEAGFPGPAPALAVLAYFASEGTVEETLAALAGVASKPGAGAGAVTGAAGAAATLLAHPTLGPLARPPALQSALAVLTAAAGAAQDGGDPGGPAAAAACRALGAAMAG